MKALVLAIVPLMFVSGAALAADGPPTFDVKPSCQAAARDAAVPERLQGCLDTEKKARDQIAQEWTKFSPATREMCLRSASAGGEPTYTEFITCLEMDRDAKLKPVSQAVPEVPSAGPSGIGLKTAVERAKGH